MRFIVFWNIINLFDGEARWFLTFLLILAVASAVTHAWRWVCSSLHKKFSLRDAYVKDAAIQASLLPLTCYVWFLAAIESIDLISDRFFSESLSVGFKPLLGVSVVLLFGWFLLVFKRNVTIVLLRKSQNREIALEPGKVYVMAKLVSVVIVVLILLLLMEVTGVSFNTLIAFGGISGLALAFASQEIISNFFGGIMIHINQPFALGDLIKVPSSDIEGYVEDIGWYETCIRSKEKTPIYIPNSLFTKAYVINTSRRTHRRIDETIGIRHQDLPQANQITSDIKKFLGNSMDIDTSEKILVYVACVTNCSVDLHISCQSKIIDEGNFLHFRDQVIVQIANSIKAHGAEIAIPLEAVLPLERKDY